MANHLKEKRVASGITQETVAKALYGSTSHTLVSLLESGRCLPTMEGMKKLCELFNCKPSDLFDAETAALYMVRRQSEPAPEKPGDTLVRLRFWVKADEKKALEKAVAQLGYTSTTEWMREQMRGAHERCRRLELTGDATVAEQLVSTS